MIEERTAVRSVSLLMGEFVVGWLSCAFFWWRRVCGRRRRVLVGGGRSGGAGSFAMVNYCGRGSTMLSNGGQAALFSPSGPDVDRAASEKSAAA